MPQPRIFLLAAILLIVALFICWLNPSSEISKNPQQALHESHGFQPPVIEVPSSKNTPNSTGFVIKKSLGDFEYNKAYSKWTRSESKIFSTSEIGSGIELCTTFMEQLDIDRGKAEQIKKLLNAFFSKSYSVPDRILQIESGESDEEKFLIKKLPDAQTRIENLLRDLEDVVPDYTAAALVDRMNCNESDFYRFFYGLGQTDLELTIRHTSDFGGIFAMSTTIIHNDGRTTGGNHFYSSLPWFLKNILQVKDE